jgi:hypothetical protein
MSRIQAIDYSVDLLQAILWQYNDAARLQSLLEQKQVWYDENQTAFWENWTEEVFDLRTANDFGCSVWSIILNVPLQVEAPPSPPDYPAFGFGGPSDEAFHKNFDHGNFATGNGVANQLTLAQKRLVLRLRYFQLVCRGTVPEINSFMRQLFGEEGNVYVLDTLDMLFAIYIFTFAPSSQLYYILESYDLLPRPAGVGVRITVATEFAWGFDEFHANFDNGNFLQGGP